MKKQKSSSYLLVIRLANDERVQKDYLFYLETNEQEISHLH